MSSSGGIVPGWYIDPGDRRRQRWWDGTAWTEHVTPDPASSEAAQQVEAPAHVVEPASASDADAVEEPPDGIAAADGLVLPKMHRKMAKSLRENLTPDEHVMVYVMGLSNQGLFGTERRAFIFKKGFMAGASFGSEMTSWDYRNLVGVQLHTGMVTGAVVIQAPGQTGAKTSYWANSDRDPHKAPNAIPVGRPFPPIASAVATLRGLIDAAHHPASGAQAAEARQPAPTSIADELAKLAQLLETGVLTPEEFAAAKQKVLGG